MTPSARGGPAPESPAVETDYAIPERSGETLLVPPPERLPSLLTVYDPGAGGAVLGVPLRDFRRRTRERVAGLAGAPDVDRPFVLMGHQPVFFHPGVWIKYFLLTKLWGINGAAGIHCVVDSDATGAISAVIPTGDHGLRRATRTLVPVADDVPLESAAVPPADAWDAFAAAVRGDLEALRMPALLDRFAAFAAAEPSVRRSAATLAAYLDGLRRAYEARAGAPRYLDVNVSTLASTPEFQAFALHLLQDPRGLLDAYNGCLDDYRRVHRVRSAANPFPNLVEAGDRTETPFWILHGGHRTNLYASREGHRLILGSAERPLATIPAGPGGVETLAGSGVALRPKALTLTLFTRLCVGDFFIHGVGGGRYDRVTGPLAQRLFNTEPAPYAVATATLHLPFGGDRDPAQERHTLERRLMDLRHNPDRHLAAAGEAERRLVDEKWRLIREVETMRPGRERRAATHRIRDVNALLAQTLAPEIARIEAQLAAPSAQPAAEEATGFRGYPFFLFDPSEVAALVPDLGRV